MVKAWQHYGNKKYGFKELIYFFVCGWKYPSDKKMTANYIIAHSAFFFFGWMPHPQTKQINLFLII
jgi:hypothetical protein